MLCVGNTSMAAPTEPRSAPTTPIGVCAADPFGLGGGAAEPPLGHTDEEMHRFVELVSRGPYCDDPEQEVDAFVESVAIERGLTRKGAGGLTLYEWLLQEGEKVVSLRCVREEFGYDLRFSRGYQMNDDAMYKRLVDVEVEGSLRRFLVELDMTAASLPGLADGEQQSHTVEGEVVRAKNQALYEIQTIMANPDATQAVLFQTVVNFRARMARRAVVLRIEHVRTAIQGVHCLAKLCQSATDPEELRGFLQSNFLVLADVCANPPELLSSQLRMRGLGLTVLAACISRPGGSYIGTSSMRPSFGRALDTIECFFSNGQRRRDIAECCVSAVNLLRRDVQAGPEATHWHGVELCGHSDAVNTVANLGLQSALRLRGPAHTCTSTGLYVRVMDDSCCALRVVRFAHLLEECVRSHVLEVGKLRASLLLPSVARWATDRRFRAAELGYFSEIGDDSSIQRRPQRPVAKEAPAPMLMCASVQQYEVSVRDELARDYHIVLAMRRVIVPRAVKIRTIKDLLTAKGGFLEKSTPASVSAAVCWVVKRCIDRANQACANNGGEMEYIKAVAGCPGGGSFRCDVQGARTLGVYLESLTASMCEGSAEFVQAWGVSRSSSQKARASAKAKAVGAPVEKRKPEVAPRMLKVRKGTL